MAYRNYSGAWLPDTNQAGVRYVKGTWASETVWGSDGPDEFEGGGGLDTLVGGAGDDYYWVRDTRDQVVEHAGGGVDTVRIWSSYTLPEGVENLIVFGGGSYAAGNSQDNIVQGLDGDQFLYGGGGQDVLVGGGGNDTFIVVQGEGAKVVQDFQAGWGDGDKLRLIGSTLTTFEQVKGAMSQVGADVALDGGGAQVLFRNMTIGQFAEDDFQLPFNHQALGTPLFVDEFDSLQTGSVWKTNFGYAGDGLNSFTLPRNGEQQIYVAPDFKGTTGAPLGLNPYSVDGGILTITAQPSGWQAGNMWGYQYTSGMLDSHYTQTYGYFEIRAELPNGQGLWPAFWLLGEGNSEIDILEGLGSNTQVPYNAIHSNSVPAAGLQNYVPGNGGFHTYGALWSPSDIIFYVDGTEVWRIDTPADMHSPMHMIVNLAVGGHWAGSPDGSTPWPAHMKVDYVKAWGLPDPNAPTTPVTPPVTPVTPPVTPPPPPTSDGGQALTSPHPGATLQGGAGGDTLTASQGSDVLTGAGGADTFAFPAMPWSAGRITDFVAGVDRLDITALYANGYSGADPVADGYLSFVSDGAGGTRVVLDVDGPGGASNIPFHVVTLQGVTPAGLSAANVLGGGGGAPPSPPAPPPTSGAGVNLTSQTYGETLQGGAGDDTLTAWHGPDKLTGGAGADHFAFDKLPWNAGQVADFTPGVDLVDLRGLGASYTGGAPGRDVTFADDGAGGTKVMVDMDGPGGDWPFLITTLQGVTPGQISASDWLFQ